jgi:hypothetical protein
MRVFIGKTQGFNDSKVCEIHDNSSCLLNSSQIIFGQVLPEIFREGNNIILCVCVFMRAWVGAHTCLYYEVKEILMLFFYKSAKTSGRSAEL